MNAFLTHLRSQLQQRGPMRWAEVMQQALYHPQLGYYGAGPRTLGRRGDFFTAVQAGPLYGRLLAQLADQTAASRSAANGFTIIEQGAHDGQLAQDILQHCQHPYLIVEPQPAMRQAQQQRLADFGTRVRWVERASDIPAQAALWICNELLDAFAVHRLQWSGGRWWEMAVQAADHDGLQWNLLEPDAALLPLLAAHPGPWLEDQCIEINLAALHWIDEVAQSAFEGLICIADYGMDEEELWSLERPKGTLRRYQQHRCDDDLLKELGECDLTSHVNFSQVRRRATEAGLRVRDEQPQGIFLTHLAKPWLGSLEGKPPDAAQAALLRQFHTLTHPSQMGSAFRVLTLEKEALTNPICQQAAATHH